ncbi:MAG: MarR family transcriptional regulator [Alphaproteobacteria bacterium]|nr:MarR family transcriptional regulator [Alphaproteobacteria bacterium]
MQDAPSNADKKNNAFRTLQELPRQIERMHRRFLDVVRLELGRAGVRDISPVQVMMLGNIGAEEISVRDLIERGYYLGSNASYNLKQLVDGAYVERQASARDRRSARLKITAKGRDVLAKLGALEMQWADPLVKTGDEAALETTYKTLRQLERCWSDAVRYAAPESGGEI